ncbi:MAG TPA: ABC transporter permease [Ktedonobacteraceae bacterium]
MSATIPSPQQYEFHPRSNARASLTAFLAIVSRDLLVMRREVITFLLQTLIQPLFFLFVFGKVLSTIGAANAGFSTLLLPGIVALTVFLTAFQGPAVDLARDLGVIREIDDRLLAPLPIVLVAIEKVLLATLRALIGGAFIFPLAFWILGSGFQIRTDMFGVLIGLMVLVALVGASVGLVLGTAAPIQMLPLIFALVLTPLMFTGCTFYPWAALGVIKWFQIVTLFNPLTYAAEGMRYAMVPPVHGQPLQTLAIGWVLLALCASFILALWGGLKLFQRRVVS